MQPSVTRPVRTVLAALAAALGAAALTACSASSEEPAPTSTAPTDDPAAPVMAVIGDSYSQGTGTDSLTWWQHVARAHRFRPAGKPVSGTGYCAGGEHDYAHQVAGVVAAHPALVVVAGSRNDFGCPAESVRLDAAKVYADLTKRLPGVPVHVVGPMWDSTEPTDDARGADRGTREAALDAGLPYVDALDAGWLRGHPEWIAGDGVHPTDQGVDALARGIDTALTAAGAFGAG